MKLLHNDCRDALAVLMNTISGPVCAAFQNGKCYDSNARFFLNERIRIDVDVMHADHVLEHAHNLAWRNWAMICDLAEKVWLHYRNNFDKMLDLILVGQDPPTLLTAVFDTAIVV
jgi:hypothetical protein